MNERSLPAWNPNFTLRESFQTPRLLAGSWGCDGTRTNPGAPDVAQHHEIWIQRVGLRSLEIAGRRVIADPLTAVFHNAGEEFRSRTLRGQPQETTVVLLSEAVLAELQKEKRKDRGGGFAAPAVRLGAREMLSHFRLQRLLRTCEAGSALELEEAVVGIVSHLLRSPGRTRSAAEADRRSVRTRRAHRDLTEDVRQFLVESFAERILLEDIARAVATSPYHLSRLFTRETGMPIHRYLTRLRLQAALERMAGGGMDLSRIALEVGFSSHSHLTTTFRRELGEPPSWVGAGMLPQG